MKKGFIYSAAAIAVLSMVGCSGGGTSEGNQQTATGEAYYVDSAVEGVRYVCGEREGLTGEDGRFIFEKGSSCTFYLDNIKLRDFAAEQLIDGKEMLEINLEIAKILQTLDSDGDPSNGITIDADLVNAMIEAGITKLPQTEAELAKFKEIMEDNEVTVVTDEDVKSHLITTAIIGNPLYQHCKDVTGSWIAELNFKADGTLTIDDNGEIETTTFKIENGFVFTLEEEGFKERTIDIYEDSIAFGKDADDKFYFSEEVALASPAIDCGDSDGAVPSVGKLSLAFSGKTFYVADDKGRVESWSFTKDLAEATWTELIGGIDSENEKLTIDEEKMTMVSTDSTGESTTIKVMAIGADFVDVEIDGQQNRIFSSLEVAKDVGINNFKSFVEGKTFYTGKINELLESWEFSAPFGSSSWFEIVGGDGDQGKGSVSLDIVNNQYVMIFVEGQESSTVTFENFGDRTVYYDIDIEGEKSKLFLNKLEAETYFEIN